MAELVKDRNSGRDGSVSGFILASVPVSSRWSWLCQLTGRNSTLESEIMFNKLIIILEKSFTDSQIRVDHF